MEAKYKQLMEKISGYCSLKEQSLVNDVYDFAATVYDGKTRTSGQTQIDHALSVALLLAEWGLSADIVAAGILHDILENTDYTLSDLTQRFGKEIADMVEGENKLDSIKYFGKEKYAENLRRMFLAMAKDLQIVFIKFADRLDNLSTCEVLPPAKQKRMAIESLEIYASIANRLGLEDIRGSLQDYAFRCLEPKEYEWTKKIAYKFEHNKNNWIKFIKKQILAEAIEQKIQILEVSGRVKGIYSLYQKLLRRDKDVNKVGDIFACRVIVETVGDCYAVLGLIHRHWKPLNDRIKDYIAHPKSNGYQSLHTSVFFNGTVIEFQIRTPQMHDAAEHGAPAHCYYKEGLKTKITRHTKWIADLTELHKEISQKSKDKEIIKSFKFDLFKNRIFVFTTEGDVVDLPKGATPLDFAWQNDPETFPYSAGAFVNSQSVGSDYELHSSDIVQIKFDLNKSHVKTDWLKYATDKSTHEAIKKLLKDKK